MITYRQATLWDAHKIVELWEAMRGEIDIQKYHEPDKETYFITLMAHLKNPTSCVIIAQEDEKIIGFISGHVRTESYNNNILIGFCEDIYILPEYRGTEIKEKLLTAILVNAEYHKCNKLEFITAYDERLAKIWARDGYVPVNIIFRKEV